MRTYTDRNVGNRDNKLSGMQKLGITLLVCSVFLLFCLIINFLPFLRVFILGVFGFSAYPILAVLAVLGGLFIGNKKFVIAKSYIICIALLYFILICILQTALTNVAAENLGSYISQVYLEKVTPGGVIAGFFAYCIAFVANYVGAYFIYGIFALICTAFIVDHYLKTRDYNKLNARIISMPEINSSVMEVKQEYSSKPFKAKQKQETNVTLGYDNKEETESNEDVIYKEVFNDALAGVEEEKQDTSNKESFSLEDFINKASANSFQNFANEKLTPKLAKEEPIEEKVVLNKFEPKIEMEEPIIINPVHKVTNTFKSDLNKTFTPDIAPVLEEDKTPSISEATKFLNEDFKTKEKHTQIKISQTEPTKSPTTVYKKPSPYVHPPISLLTTQSTKPGQNETDFKQKAQILEETLESFKISANVVGITKGPAVTRYEIQMPAGISVKKISQHSDDIAMMMQSYGGVRIEAPIPGKNLVGIEIPNATIDTIGLADIIESPEFRNSKSSLTVALGKDISGSIKVCDLASMPHLLIAGTTGSGKSVCLNIIIISLIYKLGPDDLRLIMIDPKRVEFTSYNGLPHLLTPQVICQPKQAINAFDWAIKEMEDRFDTFQRLSVRDIKEYNSLEAVYKGKEPKLPRIVIIVDELADLMMTSRKEMEDKIMRIAQLSRAAGIHLILATQRPSVNIITGTIKTNLPSRISFALNNFTDSNTIINQGGAEKLLGKGDMLYAPQNLPEPVRIQCPFINNGEILNIVKFVTEHNETDFDAERVKKILDGNGNRNTDEEGDDEGGAEYDPLLPKALLEFIRSGTGSISAIQRRHSVGYARAARIVDQMEKMNFVTPSDGTNKIRRVLIDEDKYNELFGND